MNKLVVAIVALALIALTACNSDAGGNVEEPEPPAPVDPTPSPLHLAGNPTPQKVGQPFLFDLQDDLDGSGAQLTLTVTGIECGIKSFHIPADDAVGEPAYDLLAPEGTRFCEVTMNVTNSGKRQVQFTPGGAIYDTGDYEFLDDEEATYATANAWLEGRYAGNTIELRPGQQGASLVEFPINIGSAPAYTLLANNGVTEDFDGQMLHARVDITPSDVTWLHPIGE